MPSSSYEDYTTIKQNTEISGFNFITNSEVGKNCKLKPFNQIYNSKIYNNAVIDASKLINATVMSNASIGPNAHLRPNAIIGKGAKIGNFVEVKNVKVGKNSKASHLTYLGDGIIGKDCNIGCGVIFCNYDGKQKNKTVLGNNVFVGSNVNLVAPIKLGNNSLVAAGSTLTDDVPENALAIARARQTNKLNYNKRKK